LSTDTRETTRRPAAKTIVFVMAHTGHLRNAEHLVRELLRRGHRLIFAFDRVDPGAATQSLLAELTAAGAETETLPPRGRSAFVGSALRSILD
jgi:UDP:flavonoid glycosyltransferase YjiC (YdhE family)